jgi:hypothetical protein
MRDADHPFFRPLWRRIAVVVVCVAWMVLEFATGQPFWGTSAAGMTGYAVWVYLWTYKPPPAVADDRPVDKE